MIDGSFIAASDGHLGTVSDFLFDDVNWLVRWLVVDNGNWLSGRKVLPLAFALGHLDVQRRKFAVRLTMQQVKDSPDIDTKRPMSRQIEADIYDCYGWSPCWSSGSCMRRYGFGYGEGALAPLRCKGRSLRGKTSPLPSEVTMIFTYVASRRLSGIIFTRATARWPRQ